MSVTLGVTLYSMTNEWLAGRYSCPSWSTRSAGGDWVRASR